MSGFVCICSTTATKYAHNPLLVNIVPPLWQNIWQNCNESCSKLHIWWTCDAAGARTCLKTQHLSWLFKTTHQFLHKCLRKYKHKTCKCYLDGKYSKMCLFFFIKEDGIGKFWLFFGGYLLKCSGITFLFNSHHWLVHLNSLTWNHSYSTVQFQSSNLILSLVSRDKSCQPLQSYWIFLS